MADFENATAFGARSLPSSDRDGRDILLVVIAAGFVLPGPGESGADLRPLPAQSPPPLTDEYVGVVGESSLRAEGQSPYLKPATDVTVWGEACAPHDKPTRRVDVAVRVGPCAVDLRVHGDRVWQRNVTFGARPSEPAPFLRMPLTWERAYGGVAASSTPQRPKFEPRNPVGCGFETDVNEAVGKPVPNLEDPRQPISRLSDWPQPVGLSPIARHWQPRVSYAGTYDDAWKRERAPLWPSDFDERFFCGAPPSLQARPHLVGGEPVVLSGMHPAGTIACRLPALRFVCRSRFTDRVLRTVPRLDGVLIDATVGRLTLYYRAAIPAYRSLARHQETFLRTLASWE